MRTSQAACLARGRVRGTFKVNSKSATFIKYSLNVNIFISRLERHLERKAWVASFGRPKMTPQSLLASPTGLSPYLRFGCLSTRLFYHALSDLYKKIKKCDPPLSLHGQLLWREFFYCAATRNPNFDKMAGNPICVQVWIRYGKT